jgi:hypothetical protein
MMLMYDLTPEQRGLRLKTSMPVYDFPPDYINKLWTALAEVDPDFRRAYIARQTKQSGDQRP